MTRKRVLSADDGVSLVEVTISLVLLALATSVLGSLLINTVTQVGDNQDRTQANQLATQLIEDMRSIAWDELGVYADDPGYEPTATDGSPTVTLGAARPTGSTAPMPDRTIQDGGVTFAATTEVVWVDDPDDPGPGVSDPDPRDYKEMRLGLVWEVRGTEYEAFFTSTRRPTVEEVPVGQAPPCTPGGIISSSVSPPFVELGDIGETLEEVTVTVETCTVSSAVHLTPAPLSQRSMVDGGAGIVWTYVFPAGTTDFDTAEYDWTVDASGTGGSDSAAVTVRFVTPVDGVLEIQSLSLDPVSPICVELGILPRRVALTAHITGAGYDDDVEFSWTSRAGVAVGDFVGYDADSNAIFQASLPPEHGFLEDRTTITVSVTRQEDALNVSQAYVIDVVDVPTGQCTL